MPRWSSDYLTPGPLATLDSSLGIFCEALEIHVRTPMFPDVFLYSFVPFWLRRLYTFLWPQQRPSSKALSSRLFLSLSLSLSLALSCSPFVSPSLSLSILPFPLLCALFFFSMILNRCLISIAQISDSLWLWSSSEGGVVPDLMT